MITCGISSSFDELSPTSGQVTYVLLSRSPLTSALAGFGSFDLHVLCTPPAFVLSQNQTLRQKKRPILSERSSSLRVRMAYIDESALVFVPATFQLLKIVPRPPKRNFGHGLLRTTIIPTRVAVRQPR